MRTIKTFLFALVTMFATGLFAQPAITFAENEYDFGTIEEFKGDVEHTFNFRNTGDKPLIIHRVTSSCGCTTPQWTQTPIEPGKSGTIKVIYNPLGRPYPFQKSITIYSNATKKTSNLYITGSVVKAIKKSPEKEFKFNLGDIKTTTKEIKFPRAIKGQKLIYTVDLYNPTTENLKISLRGLGNGISAVFSSNVIVSKTKGSITFILDTNDDYMWGKISKKVYLMINDKFDANNALNISAEINEDLSKMTIADKRNAPILENKFYKINLGKIKKGASAKGKFQIKNVGKNVLKIHKIDNSNEYISINPTSKTVGSGKTAFLNVTVDTKLIKLQKYNETFKVITNDPLNTNITYSLSFEVVK